MDGEEILSTFYETISYEKRQGGWARWDMVERYSHAIPPRDRSALPNPCTKAPYVQPPSRTQKRLSAAS